MVSLAFQLPQLLETDPALKEKKVFWTRVSKGRSFRKGELLLEVDEAAEAFLELLRAAVVCGQPQGSSCDLEEKLQDPSVEMEALIRLLDLFSRMTAGDPTTPINPQYNPQTGPICVLQTPRV